MSEKSGFGKFIERHRIASGYNSQRRLADKSGLSSATISRIEAEIQKPEADTLKTLAKYLHTTSWVELMYVCGYSDEADLLEPIKLGEEIQESPSLYRAEPSTSSDLRLLAELKKLADEFNMDLSDPKTLDLLKDALNFIKMARGEKF